MQTYEKPVIIEAHNINKIFHVKSQDVLVLSEVSLSVNKGDFLVLFGPSGCGKSTLLHILLGLEPPTSGWVDFLGKSLYDEMDEDSRTEFRKVHIGMVFQQPNWIKALSVKNNIIFALRLSGCLVKETEEKAMAILETVGMEQWADYFPTELSSGQQQRVSLARAMVTNPDILIADEPTGNLDFKSGQELMTILSRLNKEGKTIIMVTHDLEYLSFANRAISMFDGKIIEQVDDPKILINKKDCLTKRAQL
jgi:putative ABC transport system ATP-binding protein